MTRLVKGDDAPLRFAQSYGTLRPKEHPRQRFLEARTADALQVVTGSTQRRLIDEIGEVRATHPSGQPCQALQAHLLVQGSAARMHPEDGLAARPVGQRDADMAVPKAPRPHRRAPEHEGAGWRPPPPASPRCGAP